jgi:hypothetical protein
MKSIQDALRAAIGKPYFDDLKNIVEAIQDQITVNEESHRSEIIEIHRQLTGLKGAVSSTDNSLQSPIESTMFTGGNPGDLKRREG